MKRQLLFFFLSVQALYAQEIKSPTDYLNYISKEQTAISKSTWKYTSAVAHSNSARKIDNTRKQLVKSIQSAKKKISALKDGYKGDVEYRDQVLHYFDFCEKNLNEEYDKIINMQDVAEQSYDFMEAYILMRNMINDKLESENEKVNHAFLAFALKYHITLSDKEGELSKKIKISNEVFDYHTALYLVFFKANFTDGNLSASIEKKDIGGIQQNAGSLVLYADEGLAKIKAIKPYNGDSALLSATKKALEFYKKQAQQYVPKVIDFFMFNDKFENAKKSIESKSPGDRTKEEIDNFNAMVKQVNKEIEAFNKTSNSNFQEKKSSVDNWNSVGDAFISNHVPID